MPGILYHLTFAEKVFEFIGNRDLNKKDFFAGNLIPDLSLDKVASHYKIEASMKGFSIPNLEKARKDLLKKDNSLLLGMFCHLYLDYYFIEHFLIHEFNWDFENKKVINPRNNFEWPADIFFAKAKFGGILYKGYSEINQLLINNKDISTDTISIIPEILPKTNIDVFDIRRNKTWKSELNEYLTEKTSYTGDILDYTNLTNFISIIAKKFVDEEFKESYHDIIKNASTFAIVTHKRPDIDAISSSLAIFWYLVSIGKKKENIEIVIPEFSKEFSYLPGSEYIKNDFKDIYDDVLFVVDCASEELVSFSFIFWCKYKIWIDHHFLGASADYTILDISAPSCTSIIYENFKCNDKSFLNCIAYGLISDTQNLKVNYNALAKKIIHNLKSQNIDINAIKENVFAITNRSKDLATIALTRGKFISKNKNKVFCTYLLQSDLLDDEKNLQTVNHKSIITYIENNVNYTSLILLIENEKQEFKGSLRTFDNSLDLNTICFNFVQNGIFTKGGGHPYSSGFTTSASTFPNELFDIISDKLEQK